MKRKSIQQSAETGYKYHGAQESGYKYHGVFLMQTPVTRAHARTELHCSTRYRYHGLSQKPGTSTTVFFQCKPQSVVRSQDPHYKMQTSVSCSITRRAPGSAATNVTTFRKCCRSVLCRALSQSHGPHPEGGKSGRGLSASRPSQTVPNFGKPS